MSDDTQHPLFSHPSRDVADISHAAAKTAFQLALQELPWGEVYAEMISKGFRWREAAYVGWAVQVNKTPATKRELATLLRCAPETITKFANDARLQAMQLRFAKLAYLEGLPSIINQSIQVASTEGYKGTAERALILKAIVGMGADRVVVDDDQSPSSELSRLTDAQLAAMAYDDGAEAE